jgi:hypothetical protein
MSNPTPIAKISIPLELEPFINYEVILCSYFLNSEKINAACMGVHFTTNSEVFIHAYESTRTKQNLQPGAKFSINFSEDILDYTMAALNSVPSGVMKNKLPKDRYRELTPVPVLKSAWASVGCEVLPWDSRINAVCKRAQNPNIRAKIISSTVYHLPKIFNNRAMNLALEALIFVTRIPLYNTISEQYRDSIKTYKEIKKKITSWRDMDRFEGSFQLMDNYLLQHGVKGQEIFDF